MGVVIETWIKYSGGPTRIRETGISVIYVYISVAFF
jgi:hypothetical protein